MNSHQFKMPANLTASVIGRDRGICQMCGSTIEDQDEWSGKRVRLRVAFITPIEDGGQIVMTNLRTVCSSCDEGLNKIRRLARLPKPDTVWLLSQVRRGTIEGQKAVLEWLLQKFATKA